jgi:hypothetical protein
MNNIDILDDELACGTGDPEACGQLGLAVVAIGLGDAKTSGEYIDAKLPHSNSSISSDHNHRTPELLAD